MEKGIEYVYLGEFLKIIIKVISVFIPSNFFQISYIFNSLSKVI